MLMRLRDKCNFDGHAHLSSPIPCIEPTRTGALDISKYVSELPAISSCTGTLPICWQSAMMALI